MRFVAPLPCIPYCHIRLNNPLTVILRNLEVDHVPICTILRKLLLRRKPSKNRIDLGFLRESPPHGRSS